MHDLHGLDLSTASNAAAEAFNRTLQAYLGYRSDIAAHLKATLEADPSFALAHCVRGYLLMLTYKQGNVALAAQACDSAKRLAAAATPREQAHVQALAAWIGGDLDGALAAWEGMLRAWPADLLAMRLAHFNYFWLGRPRDMRASLERITGRWSKLPGYGILLGCLAFALEECGEYAAAERAGREAVERDPADLWATHAVAHVLEMQGRREEGIELLAALERYWGQANNLVHHLWWHRAMYHLELEDTEAVLELYDRRIRNLASPLVAAQPDLYIDMQNAASLLFRLERQGVDVAGRWTELADKAEARIGDCLSAFTLPHWMMALAADGREDACRRMLGAMRAFGAGAASTASVVRDVALPVCEAVWRHRRGEYPQCLQLMRPVLGDMYRLGGSHAQQDVLEQLFLDAATRAQRVDAVRALLERVTAAHPVPPGRRIGYADAARRFSAGPPH
ncbi:MAG TPA: tetratricopeptide repeat protein [Burkholderiales bacterium]